MSRRAIDCMDAGGRATQGVVAECIDLYMSEFEIIF